MNRLIWPGAIAGAIADGQYSTFEMYGTVDLADNPGLYRENDIE
jgi:hypothetical protein